MLVVKKSLLVAVGCVGVVLTGLGSGVPTEIQTGANTMQLTTASNGNNNGFTNATHWTAIGGGAVVTPCTMSAPLAPNPDAANCDYWIPSGKSMRTHKDSNSNILPKGAKPMVVGGRSWHLGGSITPATSFENAPLKFPDLYLYDASAFTLNTTCGLSNTTVTVMSDWNNPHYMKPTGTGMAFTFKGCTLKGEAGSGLKLTTDNNSTTAAAYYYLSTPTCPASRASFSLARITPRRRRLARFGARLRIAPNRPFSRGRSTLATRRSWRARRAPWCSTTAVL